MIWLYAICDRPDLPPPRGLEALRAGPLAAVFTRQSVGAPTPDRLWAQERVVERLMDDRAVLPVRFGTTVERDEDVRRLLADGEARFLELLERVRGRVELGVRVVGSAPAPALSARTGRDYLQAKLQSSRSLRRIEEPLAQLAVDTRRHEAGEALRASYLVEQRCIARFRAAVDRLQAGHPELAIVCTGPWPPYSFVGDA